MFMPGEFKVLKFKKNSFNLIAIVYIVISTQLLKTNSKINFKKCLPEKRILKKDTTEKLHLLIGLIYRGKDGHVHNC